MKLALLTVVCPLDNDVFPYMLRHYYDIGIRDFYIMLHNPDKKLESHICSFEDDYIVYGKIPDITIKYNLTDDHYHDKDLKILSDAARQDGCDWLIASDADEVLVLKKHDNICDFLKDYNTFDYGQLLFKWYEYRPTENIYENAFNKMIYREQTPRQQSKAIGKLDNYMHFVPGSHYIANHKVSVIVSEKTAFYAHFSDRNEQQYCEKMRLQAKNWHNRYGAYTHWAEKLIEDDPQGLEKLWNLMIEQNKQKPLIRDGVYGS